MADFQQSNKEENRTLSTTKLVCYLFGFYNLTLCLAAYALQWVPEVLDATEDAKQFSEGRAMYHVDHLSNTIGERLVGTPGVDVAAEYVLKQAHALVSLAKDHPHLRAVADKEEVSGRLDSKFAGVKVASAYNNLTNIVLYIAPRLKDGQTSEPALLLNSHFDSVFGSRGASDCASCVGVMLEVARALLANPSSKLATPVLFLFNGGEETLLLAAHGFMSQSKWASGIGAFINLESTGPGGPAYLFQHTGGWTVEAYAKASKYPHGSVCGQDFFDTRLLAMDTDFRMFSSQHYGTLPGIDVAYILDGAAYHTQQETVERIRKGTIQASGENILAAVQTFTDALAANTTLTSHKTNAVFFDILGRYLVTYPWSLGRALHTAPLALVLIALHSLSSIPGRAGKRSSAPISLGRVLVAAGKQFVSLITALTLTAVGGVLRTLLSGKSMVWFGKRLLFAGVYGPLAFAGLLVPHLFARPGSSEDSKRSGATESMLGFGLSHSLIAAGLTAMGVKSGYLSASWATVSVLASFILSHKGSSQGQKLLGCLVVAFPAAVVTVPLAIGLPIFVMEHLSISGSPPPPFGFLVGDVALGAIVAVVVFLTGSFYSTWMSQIPRRLLRTLCLGLIAISALVALYGSVVHTTYSRAFPKRVVLQHLHQLDKRGDLKSSYWAIAAMDPVPISAVLPKGADTLPPSPSDFLGLYPLNRMIRGVRLPAPAPSKTLLGAAKTYLDVKKVSEHKHAHGAWRLLLEVQTSQPAWGSLNITGHLLAWSFSDRILQDYHNTKQVSEMVRFAGNDRRWLFWIEVKVTDEVKVDASALFMERTEEIKEMSDTLPDWTNPMPFTGFQRSFVF